MNSQQKYEQDMQNITIKEIKMSRLEILNSGKEKVYEFEDRDKFIEVAKIMDSALDNASTLKSITFDYVDEIGVNQKVCLTKNFLLNSCFTFIYDENN